MGLGVRYACFVRGGFVPFMLIKYSLNTVVIAIGRKMLFIFCCHDFVFFGFYLYWNRLCTLVLSMYTLHNKQYPFCLDWFDAWYYNRFRLRLERVIGEENRDYCKINIATFIRHYNDVIMGAIASQIISFTIVYSTVYSSADQRKHDSSASLAFVRGIHRGPVNSPHKWSVTQKMFPFDDVIMTYLV